ncbi:hypothetical protein MIR68_004310 [Amoeboaphelidium protococcarum]|nr:hypothetical protein MIR68_004310 [Amoeboaphelidium protococcarum]
MDIKKFKFENCKVRIQHGRRQHLAQVYILNHHLLIRLQLNNITSNDPQKQDQSYQDLRLSFGMISNVSKGGVDNDSSATSSSSVNDSSNREVEIVTKSFMRLLIQMPSDRDVLDFMHALNTLSSKMLIFNGGDSQQQQLQQQQQFPSVKLIRLKGVETFEFDFLKQDCDRQQIGGSDRGLKWRVSNVNGTYEMSPTYPRTLIVPSRIGDATLKHASKFRSKGRIPALSYTIPQMGFSVTRCSQPMVGIKSKRSLQDEKLVEAIFENVDYPSRPASNIILDARPMINAVSNRAMGAGYESTEYYKGSRFMMGIENIHVMRDSLNKVVNDIVLNQNIPDKVDMMYQLYENSGWPSHIKSILKATAVIVDYARQLQVNSVTNILIHCSDGWDRTAQLTSLSALCIDPHYRTMVGFFSLIEREWCSFGHKFADRCGHLVNMDKKQKVSFLNGASSQSLSAGSNQSIVNQNSSRLNTPSSPIDQKYQKVSEKEMSPVFHQFLESVHLIMLQHPSQFEFNEELLLRVYRAVFDNDFLTFSGNCERERGSMNKGRDSCSLWDYILSNRDDFTNLSYQGQKNAGNAATLNQNILKVSYHPKDISIWRRLLFSADDSTHCGGGLSLCDFADSVPPFTVRHPYRRLPGSYVEASSKIKDSLDKCSHTDSLLQHHLHNLDAQIENLRQKILQSSTSVELPPLPSSEVSTKSTPRLQSADQQQKSQSELNLQQQQQSHAVVSHSKQSQCSNCKHLFFAQDSQFQCTWCSSIVCIDCSRYRLGVSDVLTAIISSSQQSEDSPTDNDDNERSLPRWRACERCTSKVVKNNSTSAITTQVSS